MSTVLQKKLNHPSLFTGASSSTLKRGGAEDGPNPLVTCIMRFCRIIVFLPSSFQLRCHKGLRLV